MKRLVKFLTVRTLILFPQTQLCDTWSVAILLSSLPRSYDVLITALEMRSEEDLTCSLVQSKILGEFTRKKEADVTYKETALKMTTKKEKI